MPLSVRLLPVPMNRTLSPETKLCGCANVIVSNAESTVASASVFPNASVLRPERDHVELAVDVDVDERAVLP